jgi:hypothetical protein
VHGEIGDRHLPAGHKGRRPGQQAEDDQGSSDDLDAAGYTEPAHQRNRRTTEAAEQAEILLQSVAHEQRAEHNTEERVSGGREPFWNHRVPQARRCARISGS